MLTHLIEWYGGSNPVLDCTRKLTGKVGVIINICSNVGSIPTTVTKAQVDMLICKAGVLQHNYIGNSLKKYSLYESGKD